jgi:cell division transport system permease protein
MLLTKLKRISHSGWVNFWRSGYVSLASVLVMTVTLSVLGAIVFTSALLDSTLTSLKDKVDINVYFVTNTPEDQILSIQKQILALPEVASADYTSQDTALADFKTRHTNDTDIIQSLSLLDSNPLQASLNIRAKDPSQYESISQFLSSNTSLSNGTAGIISKVTYNQNKNAIDALSRIISSSHKLGLALTVFFALVSILITFNTIRLAIYFSREEIAVMRLVGASNTYIRGPFVIEGLLYGLISALVTMILLYPALYWIGPISESLGTGINLFTYYLENFFEIFAILIFSGLFIGAVSSFLAVKKYLKI